MGLFASLFAFLSDKREKTSEEEMSEEEMSEEETSEEETSEEGIDRGLFASLFAFLSDKMEKMREDRSNRGLFEIENGRLIRYHGDAFEVRVPKKVTEIGEKAFANCKWMRSLTLPNRIERIGNDAFQHCESLVDVKLPKRLRGIGARAFRECRSLRTVVLPKSVEEIGNAAFYGCRSLESVELAEGLKKIGMWAFGRCHCLKSIHLPEGICEIGDNAFADCTALQTVTLPRSLRKLGRKVFFGCEHLEHLTLPEGLECVEDHAFDYCEKLRSLTLPQSLRRMGWSYLDKAVEIRIPGRPGQPAGPLLEEAGCLEGVMRALRCDKLIAPQLRWGVLEQEENRHAALRGFLHAREEGLAYEEEASWLAYGRQEKVWLCAQAAGDRCILSWLLQEKLLTQEEARSLLGAADLESRVLLLDYLQETFPAGEGDA